MTPKQRKALEMAQTLLFNGRVAVTGVPYEKYFTDTRQAVAEALAEPEPVNQIRSISGLDKSGTKHVLEILSCDLLGNVIVSLPNAPRRLTDDEILDIAIKRPLSETYTGFRPT